MPSCPGLSLASGRSPLGFREQLFPTGQRRGVCSPHEVSSHVSYSTEKAGPEKGMAADTENAEGRGESWGHLSPGGSWS